MICADVASGPGHEAVTIEMGWWVGLRVRAAVRQLFVLHGSILYRLREDVAAETACLFPLPAGFSSPYPAKECFQ